MICFLFSDMKLHLQTTDYGKLLSSSADDLTVSLMDTKLRESLVTEFSCLRSNALPPLSTFLDYITYDTHTFFEKITTYRATETFHIGSQTYCS